MKLTIDQNIFEAFPSLRLGVVVAKGVDNVGENTELTSLLSAQCKSIRDEYDLEAVKEEPKINSWREAYRSFGAKPKKYSSSVESLYRMVLEGRNIRHISKLVDLYNLISLKHMVPVGGDDTDKVDGDIVLQFAQGDENFIRLNSSEIDHPKEGEVVYADDKEILCRRWNWRECDKSKMTEETKNVALVVEGLSPITKEDIQTIVDELAQLVTQFCGGEVSAHILDVNSDEVIIKESI